MRGWRKVILRIGPGIKCEIMSVGSPIKGFCNTHGCVSGPGQNTEFHAGRIISKQIQCCNSNSTRVTRVAVNYNFLARIEFFQVFFPGDVTPVNIDRAGNVFTSITNAKLMPIYSKANENISLKQNVSKIIILCFVGQKKLST